MGNKFGRRRQVVDDKFTKPQGLYPIKDVDYKKLRKLILESKLAPCYPGGDECDFSHFEECPICFLHYPTLNRSRCCLKSICTECFLQMKNPNSARPTQCPFCKASNYAVEYRGVKSKEERGLEQVEEQKVIEAKIRMRQQELQDEEERMHKRLETSSSAGVAHEENSNFSTSGVVEGETLVSSYDSDATPLRRPSLSIQQNRVDGFDLDLEDIMVMEAIWLSIQENGNDRQNYLSYENATPEQYSPPITTPLEGPSSSSPSGGLACAIAALAESQQVTEDQSGNYNGHASVSDTLPSSSRRPSRINSKMSEVGDWGSIDHESILAEAGTSYGSTNDSADDEAEPILPPPPPLPPGTYTNVYTSEDGSFQSIPGPIVPESFEEQMMLAMAVSLAEARSRTATQGVAWN